MPNLLIVTPCFNEESTVSEFVEAVEKVVAAEGFGSSCSVRILFVNDGSADATLSKLQDLSRRVSPVVGVGYISFARNFGYQAALVAGLQNIGTWPDAVVTMDCDLEHPLETASEMYQKWQKGGVFIVNGIRLPSTELPFLKRFLSGWFYTLARILTGLTVVRGQADFRLWDANLLRQMHYHLARVGSLRLFASWLNVPKSDVVFEQVVQQNRSTRFSFKKNIELAVGGIVRFSNFPFQVLGGLAAIGLGVSVLYGSFVFISWLKGDLVPGWTSLVAVMMFFGCLQLLGIWVGALYLKRLIFDRDLPLYLATEQGGWVKE